MAEKTHETNVPAETEQAEIQTTREESRYLVPAVDIYETPEALKVIADVPGVKQDGLSIQVENDVLTIDAKTSFEEPQDALLQEFALRSYYRQFQLGDRIDQEKIGAELKHGVLTLTLPKVAKAQPRKVEVKVV